MPMKITQLALSGFRPKRAPGSSAVVRCASVAAAISGRIAARVRSPHRDLGNGSDGVQVRQGTLSALDAAVTMPGDVRSIRQARRWLAALLAGHPVADDAVLCLSELATNASVHSRSRQPGGSYSIRTAAGPAVVRVEVTDQGGPWHGSDGDSCRGRGLAVVAALASSWGVTGGSAGRTVWCEFTASDTAPRSDRGTRSGKESADVEPGG